MDRGAWWATVHRIAKSQKRLKQWACKHAKRSLVFWSPNPLSPGRFQGFKGPLEFPRWLKHLWYSWCASGPHLIAYTNQMTQCGQGHINSLRIRMAKPERQPRLGGWSSEPGDISLTSSREGPEIQLYHTSRDSKSLDPKVRWAPCVSITLFAATSPMPEE